MEAVFVRRWVPGFLNIFIWRGDDRIDIRKIPDCRHVGEVGTRKEEEGGMKWSKGRGKLLCSCFPTWVLTSQMNPTWFGLYVFAFVFLNLGVCAHYKRFVLRNYDDLTTR